MPVLDIGDSPINPPVQPARALVPWATAADLCSPCLENVGSYDAEIVDDALITATEVLYNFTRERWPGPGQDSVRPCARYESPDSRRSRAYAVDAGVVVQRAETFGANAADMLGLLAGSVGGQAFCGCRAQHQVGCFWLSQITLGERPITSIIEVRIDGDVVDPARYRVDDYRWLVYQPDPTGVDTRIGWPCCQDMRAVAGEPNTFEVDYTVGFLPERGGVRSAAVLACQFILAWSPGTAGQCKLPKRVTSMSRQQVTMNLSDPVQMFDKGLTGIAEVDVWVQSTNYALRSRRAAVVVPERRRQSVRRKTS